MYRREGFCSEPSAARLLEILDTVRLIMILMHLHLQPEQRPGVRGSRSGGRERHTSVEWKKNVGAPVALLVLLRAGSSGVLGLAAQVR